MKERIRTILIFVGALAVLGAIVVVSGIVPIKASSGHWAITEWFLQFAKKRSVATHSLGISPPDLDDPGLVLLGAGAYHTSCRMCHGSPVFPDPVVPSAMTPEPPYLSGSVMRYQEDELFYIVKHGIKLTGMPAWPALKRDDEVWAVVAFLRRLPGLGGDEYRRLVWAEVAELEAESPEQEIDATFATCVRCHGADGLGRGAETIPNLAGQSELYLVNALQAYAVSERHSGIMEPVAAPLSEEEIAELAERFAAMTKPGPDPAVRIASGSLARGESIALRGGPNGRIPSCVDCHAPDGVERKEAYPLLDGQPAAYLFRQLELFKEAHRGGSEYAHLMREVVDQMTRQQMRDVAAYFSQRRSEEP